ncbi:MAG: two-component regulator propeller domain-containing protein, partial [Verrucomicrobiota bacterium]
MRIHRNRCHCLTVLCGAVLLGMVSDTIFAKNQVLDLKGDGGYVQLPDGITDGLTESTVEAWVKWRTFGFFSQPLGFGGKHRAFGVNNFEGSASLQYFISDRNGKMGLIKIPGFLRSNRWIHLSAVSGTTGMKLYVDGILVQRRDYGGSFAEVAMPGPNYLGRSPWEQNAYFDGQIDELRLWKTARTQSEIRGSMHDRLTGKESGLVGLWNFDNGTVTDATGNSAMGQLRGGAVCVVEVLPQDSQAEPPCVISGLVSDAVGSPVSGVDVMVSQDGNEVVRVQTNHRGRFRAPFYLGSLQKPSFLLSAKQNHTGAWMPLQKLSPGVFEQDLVLQPTSEISGTISAFDGSPHVGIFVEALRNGKIEGRVKTDRGGHYRLSGLPPGNYRVRALSGRGWVSSKNADASIHLDGGAHVPNQDLDFSPSNHGTWQPLIGNHVMDIAQDAKGTVYIATKYGGVVHFDGHRYVTHRVGGGQHSLPIEAICVDEESGNLWIATDGGGLFSFDPGSRAERRHLSAQGPAAKIAGIHQDIENNLWLITKEGLGVWTKETETLTMVEAFDHRVAAIEEAPNGDLWIATEQRGLFRHRREAQEPGAPFRFQIEPVSTELVGPRIVGLQVDRENGTLWVASESRIICWDPVDDVSLEEFHVGDALIDYIYQDSASAIWVGTWGDSLFRYQDGGLTHYSVDDGVPSSRVTHISETPEGTLLIGTFAGLSALNTRRLTHIVDKHGLATSEPSGLNDVTVDSKGRVYFATNRNGLAYFEDSRLHSVTEENGLPGNEVSCLWIDPDGAIWIGTPQGLAVMREGELTRFDGLLFVDQIRRAPSGELWVTSSRGLARINEAKTRGGDFADVLVADADCFTFSDDGKEVWTGHRFHGVSHFHDLQESPIVYNKGNQLINNRVYDLHMDVRGQVWVATENGVSRYDGLEWESFTSESGLLHNTVYDIHETKDGVIWFATYGGVSAFDGV